MTALPKSLAIGLGVIALSGAAWVGASQYGASRIEAEIKALAARPSSETGWRILEAQHHGSFLGGTGRIVIAPMIQNLDNSETDLPTGELSYSLSTLLLPGSLARFTWTLSGHGATADALKAAFGTAPAVSGSGRVGHDGTVSSDFSIPEINLNESGTRIAVSPVSGAVAIKGLGLQVSAALDRLTARGQGEAMDLSALAVQLAWTDYRRGLGVTEFSLGKIATQEGTLEQLRHKTETTVADGRLSVRSSDTVRQATVAGETLTDLALDIALTGLHADSLYTVAGLLSDSNGLQNLTLEEDERFRQALRGLLEQGLSVGVSRLSGKTAKGSLDGKITVELRPAALANAPISLVKGLRAEGDVQVSGETLPPEIVQMAVAMGLAQPAPQGLKAEISFADGALRANGRALDPQGMLQALSMTETMLNAFLDHALNAPAAIEVPPDAADEDEDADADAEAEAEDQAAPPEVEKQ